MFPSGFSEYQLDSSESHSKVYVPSRCRPVKGCSFHSRVREKISSTEQRVLGRRWFLYLRTISALGCSKYTSSFNTSHSLERVHSAFCKTTSVPDFASIRCTSRDGLQVVCIPVRATVETFGNPP